MMTLLMGLGVPTALVGALIGFWFRRLENRMERLEQQREQREQERKEYELFNIKLLAANTVVCEANAIALQRGKCNGETKRALAYLQEVKHEQREFLMKE